MSETVEPMPYQLTADEKCELLDELRSPRYRDIRDAFDIQYHATHLIR